MPRSPLCKQRTRGRWVSNILSRCHCFQDNVCILQFSVLPIPEVVLRSLCRGVLCFSFSLRVSGVSAFLSSVPPAPPPAPPVPLEFPLQAPPANSESPLPPMPSCQGGEERPERVADSKVLQLLLSLHRHSSAVIIRRKLDAQVCMRVCTCMEI